jgi:hypothetical protein
MRRNIWENRTAYFSDRLLDHTRQIFVPLCSDDSGGLYEWIKSAKEVQCAETGKGRSESAPE